MSEVDEQTMLLDLDDKLILLTPTLIRKKVEEHRKQLKLWESLLFALDRIEGKEEEVVVRRRKKGEIAKQIYEHLLMYGPSSRMQISKALGVNYNSLNRVLKGDPRFIMDGNMYQLNGNQKDGQ